MQRLVLLIVSLTAMALLSPGCGDNASSPVTVPPPQAPPASLPGIEQKVANYKIILGEDPANLAALVGLGNLMMDNARYTEAIENYQKALEIVPEDVNVRVDMGTCYRKIGRSDKAVEEYRKGLSYNPNHLNALANMGVVLAYDMHDTGAALEAWERFLKLGPNHPMAAQIRQEVARIRSQKK